MSDTEGTRETRYAEAIGSRVSLLGIARAVMAVADEEQAALRAEAARQRDGADETPMPENAWPTAVQMWHKLLHASTEDRLTGLDRLIEEAAANGSFLRGRGVETDTATQQADLAEILRTLGLGDHARPYSPHEVVQREVLPALRAVLAAPPAAPECGVPFKIYSTSGLAETHNG